MELGFNTQDYAIPTGLEPIKLGWYLCTIVSFELGATKAGDGQVLTMTLQVDESQHPQEGGRKLFERMNIHNPSQTAQNIARGTLRKIGECVGVPVVTNTDLLCSQKLLVKVGFQAAKGEYKARNVIDDYKPVGGLATAAATAGAAPVVVAPVNAAGPAPTPAWARGAAK